MTSNSWGSSSLGDPNVVQLASVDHPLLAPTSQNAGTMEGNQHAFAPRMPFSLPLGAGGADPEALTESQYTMSPETESGNQAKLVSQNGSGGSHPNTVST
jgi:hypothetical protein